MCCLKFEYDEYEHPKKSCDKQCGSCQHPCADYLTDVEVDESELKKLED